MTGLVKISLFAFSLQAAAQVALPVNGEQPLVPPAPVGLTEPIPVAPGTVGLIVGSPQEVPETQRPRFMSTVQVAVHEANPELQKRSQKLVVDEFRQVIATLPALAHTPVHVRTAGKEVILSLFMDNDQRVEMQQAVATLINHLNGVVPARGRSSYYRTNLSQPFSILEVVLGEKPGTIRAISAQDVRLPDILAEIKHQFEERRARIEEEEPPALMPRPGLPLPTPAPKKPRYEGLSYFVSGGCANGMVTWSFGEDSAVAEEIPVDALMQTLAQFLEMDRPKMINGTYIFAGGQCSPIRKLRRMPEDVLRSNMNSVLMGRFPSPSQVHFPLPPLGQ